MGKKAADGWWGVPVGLALSETRMTYLSPACFKRLYSSNLTKCRYEVEAMWPVGTL